MMAENLNKGKIAENAIRHFFTKAGYFAVTSIKLEIERSEITDVDIWAYGSGGLSNRFRLIADCKDKDKKAKGPERIFWLEGLKRYVSVEHAVIVTTDKRIMLDAIAERLNIRVIGPEMLNKIKNDYSALTGRLGEDEFVDEVMPLEDKLTGNFRQMFERSKSKLLFLNFDSINQHLLDIHAYLSESTKIIDPRKAIRLFYMSAAFILITLDFLTRDAPFRNNTIVAKRIDDGIRYGAKGRVAFGQIIATMPPKKRAEMSQAVDAIRSDILAEYLSKYLGTSWPILTAIELDGAAHSRNFMPVKTLSADAQSVIGVLLDYLNCSRGMLFDIV